MLEALEVLAAVYVDDFAGAEGEGAPGDGDAGEGHVVGEGQVGADALARRVVQFAN